MHTASVARDGTCKQRITYHPVPPNPKQASGIIMETPRNNFGKLQNSRFTPASTITVFVKYLNVNHWSFKTVFL
jgi:hypothetical protein